MAIAAVSKGSHMRDASFSSYLDTADTDFVRSLAASMHGSSPLFTPSRLSSSPIPSPSPMSKRRTRGPLGELGVFGAEGYFSEKVDYDDHHNTTPRIGSIDRHRNGVAEDQVSKTKHKSKPMTPSIRSESTRSSKSGSFLTCQTSRDTDQVKPKKSLGGPWFFAGLQCKGSCCDAKPPIYMINQAPTNQRKGFWEDQVVQINSKKQPSHQPRHQLKAGETTVLGVGMQPERMLSSFAFPNFKDTQEEDPRKSVEVFGLHNITRKEEEEDTEDMAIVMERKLSMQSWDAIPITSQHKRRSSGSCRFDDMDSDASSDLFDIAVFPAEMSPVTAPYEPSEASIEWSVVTASAAEFSAVSDHDEERQIDTKKLQRTPMEINNLKSKPKGVQSGQRSTTANGGILGCRSDKAVKIIAPTSVRMASYPPIPPKKTQTVKPSLNDSQVFSPANTYFASKAATATTTTITPFSPSPSSSARAPRAIYMYK